MMASNCSTIRRARQGSRSPAPRRRRAERRPPLRREGPPAGGDVLRPAGPLRRPPEAAGTPRASLNGDQVAGPDGGGVANQDRGHSLNTWVRHKGLLNVLAQGFRNGGRQMPGWSVAQFGGIGKRPDGEVAHAGCIKATGAGGGVAAAARRRRAAAAGPSPSTAGRSPPAPAPHQ